MTTCASDLLTLSVRDSDVGILSARELKGSVAALNGWQRPALLLYGFRDCPEDRALLERVTGSRALCVSSPPPTEVDLTWTTKVAPLAPELVGLDLTLRLSNVSFSSFVLQDTGHEHTVETLALLGGRPWFLRMRTRERWVYLLGIDEIPDAEMVVSSAVQELPLVSAAIALLLFVRTHFPEAAWFAPESFGNFVIDDPLLRPSYGFVHHEQLASRVVRARGAATIAFIPWNARRTAKKTAALYRTTAGLSICPHGFEHLRGEFATSDVEDLRWRAASAIQAMCLHQSLTGVGFEPVMIFPQGQFSSHAIDALASAGFLAAANSTFLATDVPERVRLKHLLEPAVTAYGSLPLFRRRAPEYMARCRYDLILGKPLLLVAHHGYFKDHGEAFEHVFETIRVIAPPVQWVPLGHIATRVHLLRAPAEGHREVRFYCRQFRFRVPDHAIYEFTKRDVRSDVRAVYVNGRPVDFTLEQDTLHFVVPLDPNDGEVEVAVEMQPGAWTGKPRRNRGSRLSVAARRYVSEARDTYIATTSQIRSGWSRVRSLVKHGSPGTMTGVRPKACVFGASLGVDNRGVLALGVSLARLLSRTSPGTEIFFHYGSGAGGTKRLGGYEEELTITVHNCRMSPKSRPAEHILVILSLALLHRLGWRRPATMNPWLRSVLDADLIGEIRGGDSFSDIYGFRRFLLGSLPLLSVALLRRPYVMLPQTYGPFRLRASRALATFLLARATTILTRDRSCCALVERLCGKTPAFCPDVAFTLEPLEPRDLRLTPSPLDLNRDELVIGLNVSGLLYMGGYTGRNMFQLRTNYRELVNRLIVALLMSTRARILLVPHVFGSEQEEDACASLLSAYGTRHPGRLFAITQPLSERELKWVIGKTQFFIGARMHACIAALSQCVPTVGLAYSDKFLGVFESAGVGGAVVDLRKAEMPQVIDETLAALTRRVEIAAQLKVRIPAVQQAILYTFRRLLPDQRPITLSPVGADGAVGVGVGSGSGQEGHSPSPSSYA